MFAPALRIGPFTVDPPVVLAPMAGVTDAPFRVLCASFGGGMFVNQMVTAQALKFNNKASWELARFHPEEQVRSLQLYGTDPTTVGEVVRRLVAEDHIDHLDMNFGCPAPKVTRNGGGAALPVKRRLLRSVIGAAVEAADAESGGRVPVTVKFRLGIDDDHLTFLDTGRIAADEGVAAVALHARTALQHYAPPAHWERIAELVDALAPLPVMGNGDIFAGEDAVRMMATTGCAGVVVGRGCLGRPWLFRDLHAALTGQPVQPAPLLGEVADIVRTHLRLALEWRQGSVAHDDLSDRFVVPAFRKHLSWYLKGYPVGAEVRRSAGQVSTADDVHQLLDRLDPSAAAVVPGDSVVRSHSGSLKRVALPEGWLDDPDEDVALDPELEQHFSGG
ncbi:MAG: tRNA dihydrouridine synthase DusB [Actinomycetes bacterium]